MAFNAYIDDNSITSIVDAKIAGYKVSMDVVYSGGTLASTNFIQLLRYISEPIGSPGYIPLGSSISGTGFQIVLKEEILGQQGVLTIMDDLSGIDQDIRNEIFNTRDRYVAWMLIGEGFPGFGVCPYVFVTHIEEGISCYSPRTQVLHDVLHFENDFIWFSNFTIPGNSFSRIAVDMHSLYTKESHQTPNGIGGWVYIADRNGTSVYRLGCKNGKLFQIYNSRISGPRGLALNPNTLDAFIGGDGPYICQLTVDQENPNNGQAITVTRTNPYRVNSCYGMTPVHGSPGVLYEMDPGGGVSKWDVSNLPASSISKIYSSNLGYGIVSDPFENIFISCLDGVVRLITGPNGTDQIQVGPSGVAENYRGMTAEFPHMYPNDGDSCNLFIASSGWNKVHRFQVSRTSKIQDSVFTYSIPFSPYGVGTDSENNIYTVGSSNKLHKLYRVRNNEEFPLGAMCRYPSDEIEDFNGTLTNTKEIEWFLLRDPDAMQPAAAAAYINIVESDSEVKTETVSGVNYTRTTNGIKVSGSNHAARLQNVLDWYALYGSVEENRTGRRVWPNYDVATETISNNHPLYPQNDRYLVFNMATGAGNSYMYSDFTGNVLLQSLPVYLEGIVYSDINPNITLSTSSASSFSSSSRSSVSSSSEIENIYTSRNASYISDCSSMRAINNPMLGDDVGMDVIGRFEKAPAGTSSIWRENRHLQDGGLEKTVANGGAIFCKNSSKLFTFESGAISLKLCFPDYNIINGVYGGLDVSEKTMEDFVLFGVNLGEHYITQPGIYGALTKQGIEFTVWTSGGKYSLFANNLNLEAGEDLWLDFIWDLDGIEIDKEQNMMLIVNGNRFSRKAEIHNNSLADTFGPSVPAPFWLLDTPYRKSDLHAIIRRIEIYRNVPKKATPNENQSSSSSSNSSQSDPVKFLNKGSASLDFEVFSSRGPNIKLEKPNFHRVVIDKVDMRAVGPVGSSLHKIGEDSGEKVNSQILPAPLLDLPPGFTETRGGS